MPARAGNVLWGVYEMNVRKLNSAAPPVSVHPQLWRISQREDRATLAPRFRLIGREGEVLMPWGRRSWELLGSAHSGEDRVQSGELKSARFPVDRLHS